MYGRAFGVPANMNNAGGSAVAHKYLKVIFNVPNLICYFRLFLAGIAWLEWANPSIFIPLLLTSCALDFLDGIAARRLNQCSAFGAWLDVTFDNITRGMIWCMLYPSWGFIVPFWEWLTFVCTHQLGENWKVPTSNQPRIVSLVMADNFHGLLGQLAILSVWLLPLWLYYIKFSVVTSGILIAPVTTVFLCGRLLGFLVECWFIVQHMKILLEESADVETKD